MPLLAAADVPIYARAAGLPILLSNRTIGSVKFQRDNALASSSLSAPVFQLTGTIFTAQIPTSLSSPDFEPYFHAKYLILPTLELDVI